MIKVTLLILLALPLLAADTESDIAKVNEALHAAYRKGDTVALAKLLTDGYQSPSLQGVLRDFQGALAAAKSGQAAPADLKTNIIKTVIYSDTVLQIAKESYTTANGVKREVYRTTVFVRQSGVWKIAYRAGTIIAE